MPTPAASASGEEVRFGVDRFHLVESWKRFYSAAFGFMHFPSMYKEVPHEAP
jgi:hypothetical protein